MSQIQSKLICFCKKTTYHHIEKKEKILQSLKQIASQAVSYIAHLAWPQHQLLYNIRTVPAEWLPQRCWLQDRACSTRSILATNEMTLSSLRRWILNGLQNPVTYFVLRETFNQCQRKSFLRIFVLRCFLKNVNVKLTLPHSDWPSFWSASTGHHP